jgi:phytoene desaturase
MAEKTLIVGTGLGGLATALRLTSNGQKVEMVEKYHQPGGRLNRFEKDGFLFDTGPSFFSMSYEFDELFESCGVDNPLTYEELDPIYRVYYGNRKKPFDIYKNLEKLALEFEEAEPDFVSKMEKYLKSAGKIFHKTENIVVKQNFSGKLDYLFKLLKVPPELLPFLTKSMWKNLEQHFKSEEAKVIFSLVAFFLGSTPFQTPAIYSLLNYTELVNDGYWNVKGGMYEITSQIVKLLEERGVKFHYGVNITEYREADGELVGLIDDNGKEWTAANYVINADAASFRGQVLNRQKYTTAKLDKMEWTLAPYTIYLGVDKKVPNLAQHNYFLGENFRDYADTIFTSSTSPERPYYYVNVSSRSNQNTAPKGCENLFVLCPVPDLRFKETWNDSNVLAENILSDLSSKIDIDLSKHTITKTIWTPEDWQDKFNLYRGSGLGLAHGLNQIGGFRPSNVDEEFKNLFYVGASTTPGTGLPIVVMSSKLVTDRILNYG